MRMGWIEVNGTDCERELYGYTLRVVAEGGDGDGSFTATIEKDGERLWGDDGYAYASDARIVAESALQTIRARRET